MYIKMKFFFLASIFICNVGCSQNPIRSDKFQTDAPQFYKWAMDLFETVPGMSIVFVKDDEILLNQGFGFADLPNRIKSTQETNYYIASCTKSFTALLASILDKEGIIKLNDPLAKYFPHISFDQQLEAGKITIRDLLTHTSGIENDPLSYRMAYSGIHDLETRITLMKECQPNKAGHGNFSYTNTGYNIYAIILEKATGRTWKDWLDQEIFQPLRLNRTTAYMSKASLEKWPQATPHLGRSVANIEAVYLKKKDNTMQAAGGLITSAEDLGKWLQVQIGDGYIDGKQIFSSSMIQVNRSPIAKGTTRNRIFEGEGYGLGWQIGKYNDNQVIWHFGGFPGFYTHISYLPDQKLGVAVLINEGFAGGRLMNLFASYAYDYFLGTEDVNEKYKKKAKELAVGLNKALEKIKKDEQERAERIWQLSKPLYQYCGTFTNKFFGPVTINQNDSKLMVQHGNLSCIATAFTKPETMRVEMVPGRGEVIEFVIENKEVVGFKYQSTVFKKK